MKKQSQLTGPRCKLLKCELADAIEMVRGQFVGRLHGLADLASALLDYFASEELTEKQGNAVIAHVEAMTVMLEALAADSRNLVDGYFQSLGDIVDGEP